MVDWRSPTARPEKARLLFSLAVAAVPRSRSLTPIPRPVPGVGRRRVPSAADLTSTGACPSSSINAPVLVSSRVFWLAINATLLRSFLFQKKREKRFS